MHGIIGPFPGRSDQEGPLDGRLDINQLADEPSRSSIIDH